MKDDKNTFELILGIVLTIYIVVSQIMTVVFLVDYIKGGDSLLEIIIIDPWISELKGILWPFFI